MHHTVRHIRQTAQRRVAYDLAVAAALAAGGALLIALALGPGALAFAAPPDGPPGADRSAEANRGARAVPHGEDAASGREQAAAGQPSADDDDTAEDGDATPGDEGDAPTEGDDRATPGAEGAAEDTDAGDEEGSDRAPGDTGEEEPCAGDLEVRIVDVEGELQGGARVVLDDDADVVDGTFVIPDGLRVFSGLPCAIVAVSLAEPPEGMVLIAREATEKLVTIELNGTAAVEFAVESAPAPPEPVEPDTTADGEERAGDAVDVLPAGPRDRAGDGAALDDPSRHPRTGVGTAGLAGLGTLALVGGGALLRRRDD